MYLYGNSGRQKVKSNITAVGVHKRKNLFVDEQPPCTLVHAGENSDVKSLRPKWP